MTNELTRHKKSDKVKWILTFIVLIMVSALIIGVCMQLFAKEEMKPLNWGKKPAAEATVNSYTFKLIPPEEGIDFCARKIECEEIFSRNDKMLFAKVKTADEERTVALIGFTYYDWENGIVMTGWSDSGSPECSCGIFGVIGADKKATFVMSGDETEFIIETDMKIKDLGMLSTKEWDELMGGGGEEPSPDDTENNGNVEVTE